MRDYKDPRIERDIGDEWGRTPHFLQMDQGPKGVLYVPNLAGGWKVVGCLSPEAAIRWLDNMDGQPE